MTRYEQGFLTKCAEYGIDGRAFLEKQALLGRVGNWMNNTSNRLGQKVFGDEWGDVRTGMDAVGRAAGQAIGNAANNAGNWWQRNVSNPIADAAGTATAWAGDKAVNAAGAVSGAYQNARARVRGTVNGIRRNVGSALTGAGAAMTDSANQGASNANFDINSTSANNGRNVCPTCGRPM